MKVSLDSGVMMGICDVQLEGCTASEVSEPISVVHTPQGSQINVCASCQEKRFRSGEWTK